MVSTVAHKPKVPIMGGLTQMDQDKWSAWTGGRLNLTWTGFVVEIEDYETPNQLRTSYDVKGYNHRKSGLSVKFNKTDMLIPFKNVIWNHLKDNGLDTIAYLPDLRNEMSCVIYDHSRYTLESARMASGVQMALYDKYDNTNNTAAIAFLLDSLSPELNASKRGNRETSGISPICPSPVFCPATYANVRHQHRSIADSSTAGRSIIIDLLLSLLVEKNRQ
jgi:hypothetical protein